MANKLAPLATLALLVGCAAAPQPDPAQDDPRETVISLPLDMGKLKLDTRYDYSDPRLGSLYGYAGDFALQPDVFVYPNPFLGAAPPGAARAGSPAWAAASFKDEIAYAVGQGAYESAEVTEVADIAHDWKYGTLPGKRVSLVTVREGQEYYSRAYFFAVRDRLVKVRMSWFDYPGLDENMDWFVDELIGGLRVVYRDENGGPVIGIEPGDDLEQQLRSRMDDIVVVQTRNAIMEKAASGTDDGRIRYGEFERREPITGPADGGAMLEPE